MTTDPADIPDDPDALQALFDRLAPTCSDGCGLTCGDRPCAGCLAGGFCDDSECHCDDEREDDEDNHRDEKGPAMTTDPKPPAPRCRVCTTNHGNAPCGGDCPCNDAHIPDLLSPPTGGVVTTPVETPKRLRNESWLRQLLIATGAPLLTKDMDDFADALEAHLPVAALQRENAGLREKLEAVTKHRDSLQAESAIAGLCIVKEESGERELASLREKLEAAEAELSRYRHGYLTWTNEAGEMEPAARTFRAMWSGLRKAIDDLRAQLATAIQECDEARVELERARHGARLEKQVAQVEFRRADEGWTAATACWARTAGELNAARAELGQERVQHAGCLVAAEGGTAPEQVADRGDYGWSLAYQKTLDLRHAYDTVRAEAATVAAQLAELDAKYARLVSLSSDDARRLVSARDAAEAQLAEARERLDYWKTVATSAGKFRDEYLAAKDAAEAREAELRALLERHYDLWTVIDKPSSLYDETEAALRAHPVALPKETADIPETKEPTK